MEALPSHVEMEQDDMMCSFQEENMNDDDQEQCQDLDVLDDWICGDFRS